MKKIIIFLLLVVVGGGLYFTRDYWPSGVDEYIAERKQEYFSQGSKEDIKEDVEGSVINASEVLGDKMADLGGIISDKVPQIGEVAGAATEIFNRYLMPKTPGDLNQDGLADQVFILSQEVGSGDIFFYLTVALWTEDGYQGTNAVFLGNKAPLSVEIEDGGVVVEYTESEGATSRFKITDGQLAEVK